MNSISSGLTKLAKIRGNCKKIFQLAGFLEIALSLSTSGLSSVTPRRDNETTYPTTSEEPNANYSQPAIDVSWTMQIMMSVTK